MPTETTRLVLHCPRCGWKLADLGGNRYFCMHCRKPYTLLGEDEWADFDTEEPRPLSFYIATAVLAVLCAAAAMLLVFHAVFGEDAFSRYNEKEFSAYQTLLEESGAPKSIPAAEIAERVRKGDAARVHGIVRRVEGQRLLLTEPVTCFFLPDALSEEDRERQSELLDDLEAGDEVYVDGLVCKRSPCAMKYCVILSVRKGPG